jgi:hypothetical protein
LTSRKKENKKETITTLQVRICLKGNPVQIGNGPAAVIGDEIRESHCFAKAKWDGPESRKIRESKDLPDGERSAFRQGFGKRFEVTRYVAIPA